MERAAKAGRTRRRPEGTVLYRVVQENVATFRRVVEAEGRELPRFVWREIDAFLKYGIMAHGLARVHCHDCGKCEVVAFSCKGRGFCPSGTRRMSDEAAWLVDRMWPRVPVWQWGERPADDPAAEDPGLWPELGAAAIQGRPALGAGAGCQDERLVRGSRNEPWGRCVRTWTGTR